MSTDLTHLEIRSVRGYLAALQQPGRPSRREAELLAQALDHLGTSLEELHAAKQELRAQNDELVAAREAVEAERARYQDLFEFAPDGYLVTNAHGVIQEANRAAAELLRVSPGFLLGKPLGLFVTRGGGQTFHTLLSRLSREDTAAAWEVCLQPRHGDPLDAALKVAAVRDARGRLLALRWLLRDITERKRAESLAEADRLKTTLLSMVSHDLQTPLAIIKVSLANLRRRLDGAGVPADTEEIVGGIEDEADRLNALVSNLLDLSRLQAGAWQPAREWHDLSDLLGTVMTRFDDATAARVRVSLPDELPLVYVDGVQIAQVLWNLIENALKYAPVGPPVEVRAGIDEGHARVTVADSGPGVAAAERERIFMPFYRSPARHEPGGATVRGTGLGLAICRGLVEAHGGRIWVEDRIPAGVEFHFTLPPPRELAELRAEQLTFPVAI